MFIASYSKKHDVRHNVYIQRMVIDVLKPREVDIIEFSKALGSVDGINEVTTSVTEVDVKTETVKVTVKGSNIDFNIVMKVIEGYGAVIRSIDEVSVSK
ncbi:MAG: hypothetical protein DRJ32_03110 [Thermoprotei archaeon]|nr:MAG: hypothetical protein DRJ32_03110 [Thermoprotei archaeon]RLE75587.1 MAG: hypothetical protein DRZ80_02545 [Thermoprotei archaeon]